VIAGFAKAIGAVGGVEAVTAVGIAVAVGTVGTGVSNGTTGAVGSTGTGVSTGTAGAVGSTGTKGGEHRKSPEFVKNPRNHYPTSESTSAIKQVFLSGCGLHRSNKGGKITSPDPEGLSES
jgi:hypothetical protein